MTCMHRALLVVIVFLLLVLADLERGCAHARLVTRPLLVQLVEQNEQILLLALRLLRARLGALRAHAQRRELCLERGDLVRGEPREGREYERERTSAEGPAGAGGGGGGTAFALASAAAAAAVAASARAAACAADASACASRACRPSISAA
jgi:hypothetical protein